MIKNLAIKVLRQVKISITIYIQLNKIYYCGNHFLLTMTKKIFLFWREKSYCVQTQLNLFFFSSKK